MKKKTYTPPKKKTKIKNDDFDDLIYHDAIDEGHDLRDDHEEELLINEEDEEVDLVEESNKEDDNKFTYDLPKRRGRKPQDKNSENFYVDPKKFDDEIVKYYESDKMSNELADMISKISHKLSYAKNFINYTYREDMVGDGVIRMMKALMSKKYNRDKGTNPFSYFTRIAFNAFRNRIKKEKHMAKTHEKYQEELLMMSSNYNTIVKNNNTRIDRER